MNNMNIDIPDIPFRFHLLKWRFSRPMRRPSALVLGSPVTAPMVWWKSPKYGSTPMRRCHGMGMLGSNQWKNMEKCDKNAEDRHFWSR